MEKYSITNLPKGMKGAVLRNGDFYSFDSINNITACHNGKFRYLTLEILKTDPRILFENVRSQLEHPEYYAVNYSDYDYKALARDYVILQSMELTLVLMLSLMFLILEFMGTK